MRWIYLILLVSLIGFMVWESVSEVKKITTPSFPEKRQASLKTARHLKKDENIERDKPNILLFHPRRDSRSMIVQSQKEVREKFNRKFDSVSSLIAKKLQKIKQLKERKRMELGSRQEQVFELRRRLLYGNLDQKQRMLINREFLRAERDLKIANSMIDTKIHSIEMEINRIKSSANFGDY